MGCKNEQPLLSDTELPMSSKPLVVIGYGNPGRGDDALGPECLKRLEAWQAARRGASGIEFIEDLQLNPECAVDLVGRELVLFIDAHVSCPPPFTFTRLRPARDASYSSHVMSPAAVVQVYEEIYGHPAPPSFLLSVRGEAFELGAPMSRDAEASLDSACRFCERLVETPDPAVWEAQLTAPRDERP